MIFLEKNWKNSWKKNQKIFNECICLFRIVRPHIADSKRIFVTVVGEPVVMPCHGEGIPRPKITWYRRGIRIPPNDRKYKINNGTLLIESVKVRARNLYTFQWLSTWGWIPPNGWIGEWKEWDLSYNCIWNNFEIFTEKTGPEIVHACGARRHTFKDSGFEFDLVSHKWLTNRDWGWIEAIQTVAVNRHQKFANHWNIVFRCVICILI